MNKEFEYNDKWGFFPIQFWPGKLSQFLGSTCFEITANCINILNKDNEKTIFFSDIEQIEVLKNTIILNCLNSVEKVKVSSDEKFGIKDLLDRLIVEFKTYTDVLDTDFTDMKWCDIFQQSLTFRATPFVWAVDILISKAIALNVTDIHFEPIGKITKISFRIDDKILHPLSLDCYYSERISSRLKYLAGCQSHVTNIPQEGAFKDENTGMDIRLSVFPAENGERIAIRLINTIKYKTLESLNWPNNVLTEWKEMIKDKSGLFLLTGPVGSGKTTAMYSTLSELATDNAKSRVVTIEDPVEGIIPEICQSSLEKMKGLNLAQAFKYILRQDPDIIALGEIRDKECLREALQASLSGHRVFATFHAGSSEEAILRIKQMGIDEYMVLSGLKGILELNLERTKNSTNALVNISKISNIK